MVKLTSIMDASFEHFHSEGVPAQILVISADHDRGRTYTEALGANGYTTHLADLGSPALAAATAHPPDLVVLAAGRDPTAALTCCRDILMHSGGPLLLVTPHEDEDHLLAVYTAGADEVVLGPVSTELLTAKVSAWLRRIRGLPGVLTENLQAGGFTLHQAQRQLVAPDGRTCKLSGLEVRLLTVLMRQLGLPMGDAALVRRVWGHAYKQGDHAALKNLVYRLRHKIEVDPHIPRVLVRAGHAGYCFMAEFEEED